MDKATGPAATGEIEECQVPISGLDYGAAPDTDAGIGAGNNLTASVAPLCVLG